MSGAAMPKGTDLHVHMQAAMGGDAEAMVRVGHMLIAGYGVREDSSQAASWLRQAW